MVAKAVDLVARAVMEAATAPDPVLPGLVNLQGVQDSIGDHWLLFICWDARSNYSMERTVTIGIDPHLDPGLEAWKCLGIDMTVVEFIPWSPDMATCFHDEAGRITAACAGLIVGVEHVGSTSIEKLPCRPAIDLLVGVEHLRDASGCIEPLKVIGYRCHGEDGIAGRRYFTRSIDRRCVVKLHMVQFGSEFWNNSMKFRDLLRADASSRQEYSEAKQELHVRFAGEPSAYEQARLEYEHAALG